MGEDATSGSPQVTQPAGRRRISLKRVGMAVAGLVLVYFVMAYILVPALWIRYAHRHPSFDDVPRITYTKDDHPGDPLNVALIGTETELKKIMVAARWYPADPLTLRSCLEIAEASVLKRPYDAAPVSNLYLWGRKESLSAMIRGSATTCVSGAPRSWTETAALSGLGRPCMTSASASVTRPARLRITPERTSTRSATTSFTTWRRREI